jgi:hypothetical protein
MLRQLLRLRLLHLNLHQHLKVSRSRWFEGKKASPATGLAFFTAPVCDELMKKVVAAK